MSQKKIKSKSIGEFFDLYIKHITFLGVDGLGGCKV